MFIKIPCCQTAITRIMCCTVDNILQTTTRARPNLQSRCTTGVGPTEPPTEPASITSRSLGSFISNKKKPCLFGDGVFFQFSYMLMCVFKFSITSAPCEKTTCFTHACSWNNTLGVPTDRPGCLIKRTAKTNCQEILRHPFFFHHTKMGGTNLPTFP